MRLAFIIFSMGVAVWATPPVDLAGPDVITVAILDTPEPAPANPWRGPATLIDAGADSLRFAVAPSIEEAPIMPDVPWPLPKVAPDAPPSIDRTSASVIAPDTLEFLSAPGAARPSDATGPDHRRITATVLKLRSGPAKAYRAVSSLKSGDIALVTGRARNGWVPIRVQKTGREGWAFHKFLAPVQG